MRLPETAYGPAASRETYARLWRKAGLALRAGQSAILDAVHSHAAERRASAEVAAEAGVGFAGLWLEAPLETREQRAQARERDASDADARVVLAQRAEPVAEAGWSVLDASGDRAATEAAARNRLAISTVSWREPPPLL